MRKLNPEDDDCPRTWMYVLRILQSWFSICISATSGLTVCHQLFELNYFFFLCVFLKFFSSVLCEPEFGITVLCWTEFNPIHSLWYVPTKTTASKHLTTEAKRHEIVDFMGCGDIQHLKNFVHWSFFRKFWRSKEVEMHLFVYFNP